MLPKHLSLFHCGEGFFSTFTRSLCFEGETSSLNLHTTRWLRNDTTPNNFEGIDHGSLGHWAGLWIETTFEMWSTSLMVKIGKVSSRYKWYKEDIYKDSPKAWFFPLSEFSTPSFEPLDRCPRHVARWFFGPLWSSRLEGQSFLQEINDKKCGKQCCKS